MLEVRTYPKNEFLGYMNQEAFNKNFICKYAFERANGTYMFRSWRENGWTVYDFEGYLVKTAERDIDDCNEVGGIF